jgi:hypothetical protein
MPNDECDPVGRLYSAIRHSPFDIDSSFRHSSFPVPSPLPGGLTVRGTESGTGREPRVRPDLLVLSTGLVPAGHAQFPLDRPIPDRYNPVEGHALHAIPPGGIHGFLRGHGAMANCPLDSNRLPTQSRSISFRPAAARRQATFRPTGRAAHNHAIGPLFLVISRSCSARGVCQRSGHRSRRRASPEASISCS